MKQILPLLILLLLTSCYHYDNENVSDDTLGRNEAQAYVVSTFNSFTKVYDADDFIALNEAFEAVGEYYFENGDSIADCIEEKLASAVLGDIDALLGDFAGVYTADTTKELHKTAVATKQIVLNFKDGYQFVIDWQTSTHLFTFTAPDVDLVVKTQFAGDGTTKNLTIGCTYNNYSLSASGFITSDSISFSGNALKNASELFDFAINGSGEDLTTPGEAYIDTYTNTINVLDELTVKFIHTDFQAIIDYVEKNHAKEITDPKEYVAELNKLIDDYNRSEIRTPSGKLLCTFTPEVEYGDSDDIDDYTITPLFRWNDGTTQTLSDFATETTNERIIRATEGLLRVYRFLNAIFEEE